MPDLMTKEDVEIKVGSPDGVFADHPAYVVAWQFLLNIIILI